MISGGSGDDGTPSFYQEVEIQIDILVCELAELRGLGDDDPHHADTLAVITVKERAIEYLRGFLPSSPVGSDLQEKLPTGQ